MNERIRELAEQSMLVTREDDKLVTGWMEYVDLTEYVEKFAKLIVRECADICYRIDGEYDGEDITAMWCASGILEHFGLNDDRTCEVDERLVRNP